MRKTEKAIERSNEILKKAIASLQEEYKEAEGNYRDTGYERYYNKMETVTNDIEKLDMVMNAQLRIALAERESRKYKEILSHYKADLDELIHQVAKTDPGREYLVRARSRLNNAEMEAMR